MAFQNAQKCARLATGQNHYLTLLERQAARELSREGGADRKYASHSARSAKLFYELPTVNNMCTTVSEHVEYNSAIRGSLSPKNGISMNPSYKQTVGNFKTLFEAYGST